jgi:hypothetical protein
MEDKFFMDQKIWLKCPNNSRTIYLLFPSHLFLSLITFYTVATHGRTTMNGELRR